MRGVQDPPPEHPDPLALHVEERHPAQPEPFVAPGERSEPRPGEIQVAPDIAIPPGASPSGKSASADGSANSMNSAKNRRSERI